MTLRLHMNKNRIIEFIENFDTFSSVDKIRIGQTVPIPVFPHNVIKYFFDIDWHKNYALLSDSG